MPKSGPALSLLGLNTAAFKPTDGERKLPLAVIPGTEAKACKSVGGFWTGPIRPLGTEPSDEELKKASIDRYSYRRTAIDELNNRIKTVSGDYVVFTHVPDVRDPASDCDNVTDAPAIRYRSSWFLSKEQRGIWNTTVKDPKLVAIFAGHFHSDNRDLYGLPKGPELVPSEARVFQKTYVAPPLAIKFQTDSQPTARGLLLVDLRLESSHWIVADGNRPRDDPEAALGRPISIWYEFPRIVKSTKEQMIGRPTGYPIPLGSLIFSCFAIFATLAIWTRLRQKWRSPDTKFDVPFHLLDREYQFWILLWTSLAVLLALAIVELWLHLR